MKLFTTIMTCLSLTTLGLCGVESTHNLFADGSAAPNKACVEKHCKTGPRGHRGHRGHSGHRGDRGHRGPTGAQGPAGAVVTEYAEAYLTGISGGETGARFSVTTSTPPDNFTPVPFNSQGPISSNISYDPVTHIFTINTPGTYTIEYNITASALEDGQTYIEAQIWVNENQSAPIATTISPGLEGPMGPVSEALNQVTHVFSAGDTIQLVAVAWTQESPIYYGFQNGESLDSQQMAYISIKKVD